MYLSEDSRPLKLQVTAPVSSSYLARLDKTLEESQYEKAPIEEVASRILQFFIPTVIALAIVSGIIIGLFFSPALALQCAISVLVSACPCTLGLVVPLAVKIGLQKAAAHGVEFKSAKKIQDAAAIDAIVFDLHGTLTVGEPAVSRVVCLSSEVDEQMMLAYATTLEQKSKHPFAKAICLHAQTRQLQVLEEVEKITADSSNHSGIQGYIKGEKIIIGNAKMMADVGINIVRIQESVNLNAGENIIYIARNNCLLGYLILTDPLRSEAKHVIDTLKKLKYICTGADEATAYRYAALLGIPKENVAAAHVGLAEEANDKAKIDVIQSLRAKKLKVAMLGDADNDVLALDKSDFGIAIHSHAGSDIIEQKASAVIHNRLLSTCCQSFCNC